MDKLQTTYNQLKSILGDNIDPLDAVRLVNEYREYWRPDDVRVILLAESHVFTTLEDMDIHFETPLPGYPTRYAKFVYCLAYGEKDLTSDTRHPARDGTPQFWNVIYSCLHKVSSHKDFSPIRAKSFKQRLHNKIELLQNLKRMGVWLVDTSIVGLYDKGTKPGNHRLSRALKCSWQSYTCDIVRDSRPRHVICVGKGVGKIVSGELNKLLGDDFTVLDQPNAHISTEKHLENFRTYYRVCTEYCVC